MRTCSSRITWRDSKGIRISKGKPLGRTRISAVKVLTATAGAGCEQDRCEVWVHDVVTALLVLPLRAVSRRFDPALRTEPASRTGFAHTRHLSFCHPALE